MERIKALLLEARSELKDFKAKQKPALDLWIAKTNGNDQENKGADELMQLVKFLNTQIQDAQQRVTRYEQELGQAWEADKVGNSSSSSTTTSTSAAPGSATKLKTAKPTSSSSEKNEEDFENFRKKILSYCNGSHGVDLDLDQWRIKLPILCAKAKKYLKSKQFETLNEITSEFEDIATSRTKLIKWYETTFPEARKIIIKKKPAAPVAAVAAPKSSSEDDESDVPERAAPVVTKKSKPVSDSEEEAATTLKSSKPKTSLGAGAPAVGVVKKPIEIDSSDAEAKSIKKTPVATVKKTLETSTSKKPKIALPETQVEDDDISSVEGEEVVVEAKKPAKPIAAAAPQPKKKASQ